MHLAQVNIGRLLAPIEDPRIDGFRNALDAVNAIAERSPGFVWRMKDEGGNATDIVVDPDDSKLIANMSVWESRESLEHFVFNTVHKKFYTRRAEWFDVMGTQHFALWWVHVGHQPTLDEARKRIAMREAYGDTEDAFGWTRSAAVKRCG